VELREGALAFEDPTMIPGVGKVDAGEWRKKCGAIMDAFQRF